MRLPVIITPSDWLRLATRWQHEGALVAQWRGAVGSNPESANLDTILVGLRRICGMPTACRCGPIVRMTPPPRTCPRSTVLALWLILERWMARAAWWQSHMVSPGAVLPELSPAQIAQAYGWTPTYIRFMANNYVRLALQPLWRARGLSRRLSQGGHHMAAYLLDEAEHGIDAWDDLGWQQVPEGDIIRHACVVMGAVFAQMSAEVSIAVGTSVPIGHLPRWVSGYGAPTAWRLPAHPLWEPAFIGGPWVMNGLDRTAWVEPARYSLPTGV